MPTMLKRFEVFSIFSRSNGGQSSDDQDPKVHDQPAPLQEAVFFLSMFFILDALMFPRRSCRACMRSRTRIQSSRSNSKIHLGGGKSTGFSLIFDLVENAKKYGPKYKLIKVYGYCGLSGSPVILYEIIAFVAPRFTRAERRFLSSIVLTSSVLFYAGITFSYFTLTPAALNFLVPVIQLLLGQTGLVSGDQMLSI